MVLRVVRTDSGWGVTLRVVLYTLSIFLVQAVWVPRLPYPAVRVDLLLPVMLGVAMEWSLVGGLVWAVLWGYVLDMLSGKFWGFHVLSYVVAVCVVHISLEKFEFRNPLYQMVVVGGCALGQGVVLWLYLLVEPQTPPLDPRVWQSLVIRSVFMGIMAPLLIHPVSWWGKSSV